MILYLLFVLISLISFISVKLSAFLDTFVLLDVKETFLILFL